MKAASDRDRDSTGSDDVTCQLTDTADAVGLDISDVTINNQTSFSQANVVVTGLYSVNIAASVALDCLDGSSRARTYNAAITAIPVAATFAQSPIHRLRPVRGVQARASRHLAPRQRLG